MDQFKQDISLDLTGTKEGWGVSFGIHDIEETEGFEKLTKFQQKLIRTSFLINQGESDPTGMDCKTHLADYNCHTAIASLEQESYFDNIPDKLPQKFFKVESFDMSKKTSK